MKIQLPYVMETTIIWEKHVEEAFFYLLDRREYENSSYDVSVRHNYTLQDEQECRYSEDHDKSLYKPYIIFRMGAASHPK